MKQLVTCKCRLSSPIVFNILFMVFVMVLASIPFLYSLATIVSHVYSNVKSSPAPVIKLLFNQMNARISSGCLKKSSLILYLRYYDLILINYEYKDLANIDENPYYISEVYFLSIDTDQISVESFVGLITGGSCDFKPLYKDSEVILYGVYCDPVTISGAINDTIDKGLYTMYLRYPPMKVYGKMLGTFNIIPFEEKLNLTSLYGSENWVKKRYEDFSRLLFAMFYKRISGNEPKESYFMVSFCKDYIQVTNKTNVFSKLINIKDIRNIISLVVLRFK